MNEVTQLLNALDRGEKQAANELLPLVYSELRQLAAQRLALEQPGHTLQATALVHEAYLRLIGPANADGFENRRHFFGAASEAMRRILVEIARRKSMGKHGGGLKRVDFSQMEPFVVAESAPESMLDLEQALVTLAKQDQTAAELFKLRYFSRAVRRGSCTGLEPLAHRSLSDMDLRTGVVAKPVHRRINQTIHFFLG